MAMVKVNENSTRDVDITFTDGEGNLVTPDVAWYQLIDKETETVIVALEDTGWNPTSSTERITIQAEENIILNDDNTEEEKVIHVRYLYNAMSREENVNYTYKVMNLLGADNTEFDEGEGG